MRLSRFFITRPIFAAVIAVAHHPDRRDRLSEPAGVAISRHRAADRDGQRDLSRAPRPRPSPRPSPRRSSRRSTASRTCSTMSSQSTGDGRSTITVTFKQGTDLDAAQVLVQNRVAIADAAPAGGSAAPRRRHAQDLARLPDGRQPDLARRLARSRLHLQLCADPGPRPAARGSTASATCSCSARAIMRCGSGSIPAAPPRST